jgi:DNA-binding XRE family transcriptional regulator
MCLAVYNRLKEIRMKEYMMSMSEFASLLGEKLSTYSKWENGDSNPTLEKAIDISKKINKTIEQIWYK